MRLYIFSIIFINPSLKQIISPLHGKNNKGKEQSEASPPYLEWKAQLSQNIK